MDTVFRLRELLEERDMSLFRLAKKADLNYATLRRRCYRGAELSVDTIERACQVFGIPLYEFFRESHDAETDTGATGN